MPSFIPFCQRLGQPLAAALLPALLVLVVPRSVQAQTAGSDVMGLGLRGSEAQTFMDQPALPPPLGAPSNQGISQAPDNGLAAPADQSGPLPPPPAGAPNYGKPVKPVKRYGPQRTAPRPPLPPLQPYNTAPGVQIELQHPAQPVIPLPEPPPPNFAVIPQPPLPHKPKVDDAPFAPVGIDAGSLRLFPYIESGIGYDTNPNQFNTGVKGSAFTRIEGGGSFQSEWSSNELKGELKAGYDDYFSVPSASRPDATGKVDGRIDVSRDTKIDIEGRLDVTTQSPSSPEIAPGVVGARVVGRPLIETYGGTTGVTQILGRLELSLRGSIDRTQYGDANLSDGTIEQLSRESYNAYELRARAAYEITPGIKPFLEAFGDMRLHDQSRDLSGFERNSVGEGGLAGTSFEVSRKLTGEVSLGYENRNYADRRLENLQGPLVKGSIIWSATPLTTVKLTADTSFNETDIPFASGSISRTASLEVSHALLRNLTFTGLLSYQNTAYTGINLTENTYDVGLKAEYNLSRSIVIRGSFTHERLQSSTPGLDYTQNVFLLGLRLQR